MADNETSSGRSKKSEAKVTAADLLLAAAKRDAEQATQLATTLGNQVTENMSRSEQYRNALLEFARLQQEKEEMKSLANFYQGINQASEHELIQLRTQLYQTVLGAASPNTMAVPVVHQFQNSTPQIPEPLNNTSPEQEIMEEILPQAQPKKKIGIKKITFFTLVLAGITFCLTLILNIIIFPEPNKKLVPSSNRIPPTSYNDLLER